MLVRRTSRWTRSLRRRMLEVMFDSTSLLLSALFSIIGMAVFTYGRRQRTATHTIVGLALMGYPYFVEGAWQMVGVGAALLVGMVIGSRIESD